MADVQGSVSERFASLRDVLATHLDEGQDIGASVAVIHQGQVVVDIWGGFIDQAKTKPWARDTIVNVWSTTKTMTFLVALMLAEAGELDFYQRVSHYWPEFAANGKDEIEVRHLLAHSSGLSGFDDPMHAEQLADWEYCVSALGGQAPWWSDRTRPGYHAITQGFLIGEVVRRVTGESLGQFFKREVADVLGADFHIGLSAADEPRVAPVFAPDVGLLDGLEPGSLAYRTLAMPPLDANYANLRWWRAAEIPAANGHGNARSVALIQQVIAQRGAAAGHRFFSEATGEEIFRLQASGVDAVLGVEMNYGMGYGLASATVPLGPRSAFWGGFGGSVIVMDQDLELTVAYMMNQMRVGLYGDTRGGDFIQAAVLAALG
ncbi:MAG TPA: serine hydrolase domain-containing protein [Acidimicrobiales bacterium]|nr:serine hydrolase domain-containing protein [Acidimicrobiales bacterium]